MINKNEICLVIRILLTSMFLLTYSYHTSFLARLLIIVDGDVKSNPGPNGIAFSIKNKTLQELRVDQKNLDSKEDLQKKSQVLFPGS